MLINLTDVFASEGKVKTMSVPYGKSSVVYYGRQYDLPEPPEVSLTFTNTEAGSALVTGSFSGVLAGECDRCLKEVKTPVSFDFSYQVFSPERRESTSEEEEGQCFMSGYELDVDVLINNEILMHMPVKVLCREDCKGICPVCGQNLNEGECGCDSFVPDPRMAAIKDIFHANKEV